MRKFRVFVTVHLKQELEKKGKEFKKIRNESSQLQVKMTELRQQVTMLTQNKRSLEQDNERLANDLTHNEEEVESLRVKIRSLQDAITSPSGDPRVSALNRLIKENPVPQDMSFQTKLPRGNGELLNHTAKERTAETDILSPFEIKTKQCGIVGLTKTKSMAESHNLLGRTPCKDQSNCRRLDSSPSCTLTSSQPTPSSTKASLTQGVFKRSKVNDLKSPSPIAPSHMFYNGFGGHSKLDSFPVLVKKDFKIKPASFNMSKKPKGVSRPKTSSHNSKQVNAKNDLVRPIDDFFTSLNHFT